MTICESGFNTRATPKLPKASTSLEPSDRFRALTWGAIGRGTTAIATPTEHGAAFRIAHKQRYSPRRSERCAADRGSPDGCYWGGFEGMWPKLICRRPSFGAYVQSDPIRDERICLSTLRFERRSGQALLHPTRSELFQEVWCRSGGTGFADCSLVGPHGTRQGPTPAASKRYQRHEPDTTPLYKIVAEHLETFLAEARETHERALPQYVERELREYLKCGILAHGFLRLRATHSS